MRPTLPFLALIFRCTIGFAAAETHTRCTKTELPHKPHVQRSDEYLSLVEAVREDGRNTHRTLLRLGEVSELRSSGQIDRIIRALRAYAEGNWFESGELSGEGAPSFGATAAVWSYFCHLGLDEYFSSLGDGRRSRVLSDTVFAMVANRLTDPASKRRTITEWLSSVVLPAGVRPPSLDQFYRAIDTVSEAKDATEVHLYSQLCNLTNLDLRLVCRSEERRV